MLLIFISITLIILFIVFKNKLTILQKKVSIKSKDISPLEILKTRLIDGEITKTEFNTIKKDLGL